MVQGAGARPGRAFYQAVKDVCTGPKNRERCMEALERYDQETGPCTCGGDGQEEGD